jgi:hypothetical protein
MADKSARQATNKHEEKPSTADESADASLWRDRPQIYADN